MKKARFYLISRDHFPYFRDAPPGWKNSVRHNLSMNKGFDKIEKPDTGFRSAAKKGCHWALNPDKEYKICEEVAKALRKDPEGIRMGMARPGNGKNYLSVSVHSQKEWRLKI